MNVSSAVFCGAFALILPAAIAVGDASDPKALGLLFTDGETEAIEIDNSGRRYIDELDIISTIVTPTDQGIQPVIDSGDMAGLDWSGVEMVEEDWRPDGTGAFTRQRFYRNARWMEEKSWLVVFQADERGVIAAIPFVLEVGSDNSWNELDDGFIRRFNARQVTSGCAAIGDCSVATSYMAQALAQYRHTLNPLLNSRKIRPETTRLLVVWTADPGKIREIGIARVPKGGPLAGGFHPEIEEVSVPANGQYYVPGELVTFTIRFRDDEGRIIAGDGRMPTYSEFLNGVDESGLRYYDINIRTTLYYALKHREGNMILTMSGPTDKLRVPQSVVSSFLFFTPLQAQVASVANDGWTGLAYLIPNFGIIFGGLADPAIWDTPISDQYTFAIPEDAEPGTYVIALKARRDFRGEPLNRSATARVQVGTAELTDWEPTTGPCGTCHQGESAIAAILHGIGDRETCFSCHAALDVEPDSRLDYRIHFIHSRSDRFPGDVWECLTCHFSKPEGDPIGYPGFVYPFEQ